ncbi:MAG: hypothetical protein K6F12_05065 [Streptococcus sp.]|uniref:hypothetical protein n=1 Tax=Streptococcus sp. TaxID=1306 RepID=UPI0025862071|nr:hypothetical protein [Streptococcus sp.]MCR5493018.1 hypothetical protein [Streptococcus sp.]
MIRAEIELGGQLEVINIEVKTKSEAIEKIWNMFGYMTYIISLEEVQDEADSDKPDDSGEPDGKGD